MKRILKYIYGLHIWKTSHFNSGAGTIFGQEGGQNRERQIDGIFNEFGARFCPRNKRSLKKRSSPDLDRDRVPEVSVL